jgi:hypothetical protein
MQIPATAITHDLVVGIAAVLQLVTDGSNNNNDEATKTQ